MRPSILSLLALAGCGILPPDPGPYGEYPPNPWPGIETVAVFPIDVGTGVTSSPNIR